MTRLQKILLTAILAGSILLATSGSWAPRISIIYTLYLTRNDEWLAIAPTPKILSRTVVATSSTPLNYGGLRFRIPWVNASERTGQDALAAASSDGSKALFISREINIQESLIEESPRDASMLKTFFGDNAAASQYELYKIILHSTPKDISVFTALDASLPRVLLVTLKRALSMNAGETVSEFENSEIRGFQFGNANSKIIFITLFDKKDRRYLMGIRGAKEEEIDFVLSSIKAADEK